ncbi:hypothetical protein RO602_01935 [Akkermansia muciniphila]|jgi:hypothetical protein|nr:hypothetical protein [Akkermansia muciniphila]MDT4467101.1 hypothetical protein [Akkermansia muciniphila]
MFFLSLKKHFRTLKSPQQQAVHLGKGARLENFSIREAVQNACRSVIG